MKFVGKDAGYIGLLVSGISREMNVLDLNLLRTKRCSSHLVAFLLSIPELGHVVLYCRCRLGFNRSESSAIGRY